jgi:hypothetical protein
LTLLRAIRNFEYVKQVVPRLVVVILALFAFGSEGVYAQSTGRYGPNDTILVPYIVYEGDTMIYRELDMVYVFGEMSEEQKEKVRKWTRLRNAVYVTYPYAKKASYVFNEINFNLSRIQGKKQRKAYIETKEAQLRKEFADPLMKLSVYQGKVLMKIINRETNNTCYQIVEEYKGSFSAKFWQAVAWVFGSSLKQDYQPAGQDAEMEAIVREVARMYGHS